MGFKVDGHGKSAEVKGVGAVVEDEEAIANRCILRPEVEELVDGGTVRLFRGMGRLGLVS